MAQEKPIRVCIRASQRVYYVRYTYMTPKQWAKFKATSRKAHVDVKAGGQLLTPDRPSWINSIEDVEHADDVEEGSFEAFVVDERDKPIEPPDRYTGK